MSPRKLDPTDTGPGSASRPAKPALQQPAPNGTSAGSGGNGGPDPRLIMFIGCWHAILSTATIVATLLWWPTVEQSATNPARLGWLTLTATSGMLLLGVAGGVAGSLVQTITIFGSRVGRKTFEDSFLWWYLLRPFGAALLGMVFVASFGSGLVALGESSGGVTASFVVGALAGLFSDSVLQRLRGVLGATSTAEKASEQSVPGAPPPNKLARSKGEERRNSGS